MVLSPALPSRVTKVTGGRASSPGVSPGNDMGASWFRAIGCFAAIRGTVKRTG
jgi:hypothetical protein